MQPRVSVATLAVRTPCMKQAMQVLTSSKSNEWWTPPEILDAVRDVIGDIELDPASCAAANEFVRAERIYTIEDNGLSQSWQARSLFLNSPYGKIGNRSGQDVWMEYLIAQLGSIGACIVLTKAVPGYVWWDRLFRGDWPGMLCITEGRLSFLSSDGGNKGQSKAASSLWYYGPFWYEFRERFESIGRVLEPEHRRMR